MKEPLPRHLLPLPLNLKHLCSPFFFFSFLFSNMRVPTIHPSNGPTGGRASAPQPTSLPCNYVKSVARVKNAPAGDQRVVAERRAAVGEGGRSLGMKSSSHQSHSRTWPPVFFFLLTRQMLGRCVVVVVSVWRGLVLPTKAAKNSGRSLTRRVVRLQVNTGLVPLVPTL